MPQFTPKPLRFPDTPATQRSPLSVSIYNDTSRAIDVSLDDGGAGRFTFAGQPPIPPRPIHPGATATVGLRFSSPDLPDPAEVTATLKAGDATVAVKATVLNPIHLDKESLELGEVVVGEKKLAVLLVTNFHASGDSSDVEVAVEGDTDFSVVPTIVPAAAVPQAVFVLFQPSSADPVPVVRKLRATVGTFSAECEITARGVAEEVAPEEPKEDEKDKDLTAEQRFTIEVPEPKTLLAMGANLPSFHGGLTMQGVGLETEKDVFVNGTGEESVLFAQATKKVVLQSLDESLYSMAKENNVQVAGELSYMLGSKGVVIAAGLPVNYETLSPLGGTHDTGAPHRWAMAFAGVDAVVGTALAALEVHHLREEWDPHKGFRNAFGAVGAVTTLTGAALSAAGAGDALPAASVLGLGGVVVATPAYVAIYGIAGVGIVSMYPAMIGLVDAGMMGVRNATVTARKGTATLQGQSVEIKGREKVEIEVREGAEYGSVKVEGKSIALEAMEAPKTTGAKVEVDAKGAVDIDVGNFIVHVEKDGIKIGHLSGAEPVVTIKDKTITVSAGTGKGTVLVGDDTASISFGAGNAIELKNDGITLKSATFKAQANSNLKINANGVINIG